MLSPWTLRFHHQPDETAYAAHHADVHAKFSALGSLAEVLLPVIMALKVMASGTFAESDLPFQGALITVMVVVRGLPFIMWLLPHKALRRYLVPTLLTSRLFNLSIMLQFLLMLQALCLRTHCQLVRTTLLDILLVVLLAEPLLKPLRFSIHLPMALLELAVATFTLGSPLGVCGALQHLVHPDTTRCNAACMAQAASGLPGCATKPTTHACPTHAQLGPVLRPMLEWTLRLMHVPAGGYLQTCPALCMVGQQRCAVLANAIHAAAKMLVKTVSWLTVGTMTHAASARADQRVCGELALAAILVFACVACLLYHVEASRRWQWWQAKHPQQVLHPPLRTLRTMLVVQHAYVLLGALAAASVTLLQWM